MNEEEGDNIVRVNFGKPVPLFPLDRIVLMPHGVFRLHVFEDRYRQMVTDVLDGAGQIAMGVFDGEWREDYHACPSVRPAVCLGQIIHHERTADGRYDILMKGVCRARVIEELPSDEDRLYREVMLEPIGGEESDESQLRDYREQFAMMLQTEPLTDLTGAESAVEHISNYEIPTSAILELLTLCFLDDVEVRYRLLESSDPVVRARIVEGELDNLRDLLGRARRQLNDDLPKGCNWN